MKNIIKYLLVFTFFITLQLNASQKNFTISYDPDYAPFSYLENNQAQGLLIDLWEHWAEANNYHIKFINGKTWDNALNLVKTKQVDFFLGTNAYDDWMKGSDKFYKVNTSLFIHQKNSKGFDKKSSYLIGIISKDYKNIINKNFPNSQLIIYDTYDKLIDDLISKKLDLIYDDKVAIEFFILKNRVFHEIKPIDLLNQSGSIQAISHTQSLVDIFNEGLKNLSLEKLLEIESLWILDEKSHFFKNSLLFLTQEEKKFLKNTTLNVSVSKAWKPFTFISTSGEFTGISHELWQLISKKITLKSNYHVYNSFTNQLKAIRNKSEDVIYSTGKTKAREAYSLFTNPYISFPISIATLKDENFIENMNYLKNKTLAVGEDFTAHKLIKKRYPHLKLLLVKNIKKGLEAVRNGKAYAFLEIKPALSYNISRYKYDDIKITGNTDISFDLRIMIRDDYKVLQSILNKAINSLSQDDINSILYKWENIQFEHENDYENIWIFILIVFIIVIISLYINQINIRRNRVLKDLVDERTLELKLLNENLEQKIDSKTKELKRVNYLLDEAQKIAHLGSFQFHIRTEKLYWSDELYKIFGYYPEEVIPSIKLLLDCVHQDDKKFVEEQLKKSLIKDKKHSFEFKIIKNDTIKYLQFSSKITKFDINNEALMMIGTILDLTKIKKLELEKLEKDSILAQQTKMAAMGEMLENIAHQWRQPLSAISTASTGIQLRLELNNDMPKELLLQNVKSINEHSQYLSKTIDDFRNFFNPNKVKVNFSLEKTIDKALYLMNIRLNKHHIKVKKNVEEIKIYSLENELIQVFLNIFNNAIDALIINEIDSKYIFVNIKKQKNSAIIEIIDNANGVPKDIISRIFEPYFTTKYKSQGTGIGLYMSNEIITKHLNGKIEVLNTQFRHKDKEFIGAKFIITLPFTN